MHLTEYAMTKSQNQYYKGGRELASIKHRTGKHVHEHIPKVCELYQS